ncbi:MAG: hypothetical protein JWN25_2962 [Verrucomicrobiales bacterium]|nr:hypothetical protein [Verrucomicrobiales bacterium]
MELHCRRFRFQSFGDEVVEGKFPCALKQDYQRHADHQDVVLKSFPFLIAVPVHKKAVGKVNHQGSNRNGASDAKRGQTRKQPKRQTDRATKLGENGKNGESGWNMHFISKKAHGSREPVATEKSESLLCAMRKHDRCKSEPQKSEGKELFGLEESFHNVGSDFVDKVYARFVPAS